MNDLVIVGSSGLAQEFRWLVERINANIDNKWNFLGYIDTDLSGKDVIGDDSYLINYKEKLNVIIAIGLPGIRKKLYELYKDNQNLIFPNIIDPSVIISDSVDMGIGNIICAGSILTVDIKMGDFNIVNLDCTVGHQAVISSFVTLNPSVNISGNVFIGSGSNIGTGANVIQGVRILDNSTIGAGAVVINDIEGDCTAVGVPAKVIKNGKR